MRKFLTKDRGNVINLYPIRSWDSMSERLLENCLKKNIDSSVSFVHEIFEYAVLTGSVSSSKNLNEEYKLDVVRELSCPNVNINCELNNLEKIKFYEIICNEIYKEKKSINQKIFAECSIYNIKEEYDELARKLREILFFIVQESNENAVDELGCILKIFCPIVEEKLPLEYQEMEEILFEIYDMAVESC